MKAEKIVAWITIRPSYDKAAGVKEEIEDSLSWLSDDHHAIKLEWMDDRTGEWPDPEEDDEDEGPA